MSEEETEEQQLMSSTTYGSPRRVSSPTSVQGELFVWIQSVKKELDTLLESASNDYNLLLKKIERVINKLEDSVIMGVEVETRSSWSSNSDQLVKRIELDISGTIKTSSLRERFVDGIEALQEAEGRLFSALDGILARGINRLKEDLKRISSTMVSVAENDDFSTLDKKKYSVKNAQEELSKIKEEIQSVLDVPQPLVISISGSGLDQPTSPIEGSPPLRKHSSVEGVTSPRRMLERMSPSRLSLDVSKLNLESWTANHISILGLAREVGADTDDLITLCSERLASFDNLYLVKMEEFHSDLDQVEEWLEEIGEVLKLEPAEEVELEGNGSSGSSEKYDIDQLINLLKRYFAKLDVQGHKIRKVLVFGKLVVSITKDESSSDLKSRLETVDLEWKPVQSRMHLKLAELELKKNMNLVTVFLDEGSFELSQISDIYLRLEEMMSSLEQLTEFIHGMEFREKGEKELAVLRESARVFLEAVAAGSGGDHHDDRDVTTEKSEVLAAIDGMELDFKDLSELAHSLEDFLKKGIAVWKKLDSSSTSFSEWLNESEAIVDQEFVGSTVEEAEVYFKVIVGLIDACDDKEAELDQILSLANEMLEHGISEDAASVVNSRMEDLKTDWTRLCEKLENVNIEVKETVDYWKRYIEVYETVSNFLAKMSSKLPKDPIQSADGDPHTLKKYKSFQRKLAKMEPVFTELQELASKLIESGRIQSADILSSDLSQVADQWDLMRDKVTASFEALLLEHTDLTENSFHKLVVMVKDGEALLKKVKDSLQKWPQPVSDVALETPLATNLTKDTLKIEEYFSSEANVTFEMVKDDVLSRLVRVASPLPLSPPVEGGGHFDIAGRTSLSPGPKSPLVPTTTATEEAVEDLLLSWIDLCGEAKSLASFMDLLSKLLPLWHVASGDLQKCKESELFCGSLSQVEERLREHTSFFADEHFAELQKNLKTVESAAREAESTPPENKETKDILRHLDVLPAFLNAVRTKVEQVEPASNQVVSHLAVLMDMWNEYLEARSKLVPFLDSAEPQVEEINRKSHPMKQEVEAPSMQEVEAKYDTLPSYLLKQLQALKEEKGGIKPHYLTVVTMGTKLCGSFQSEQEYEKMELKTEVDTFIGRWKAIEIKLETLGTECSGLQGRFKGFLTNMASVASWMYATMDKLSKAEDVQRRGGEDRKDTGEEEKPAINLWVEIQEIEEGLASHKPKVDALTKEVSPWQQLPFLEERGPDYPEKFVHDVSIWDDVDGEESVETVVTDDGVRILAGKYGDLGERVQALRQELESKSDMITVLNDRLDELQHWISKRELDLDRNLSKPLTPHLPTVKRVFDDLKVIEEDLNKRCEHKNGLLAEAGGVLHQVSPSMVTTINDKMAAIGSSWDKVEDVSGKFVGTLGDFIPKMEDLWAKIHQFEKFLSKFESILSDLKPIEADLPKLERQKSTLESVKEGFLEYPLVVSAIREPWDKLTGTYSSLKDPPPVEEQDSSSVEGDSPVDGGETGSGDVNFENQIGSAETRFQRLREEFEELPEFTEQALNDVQSFNVNYAPVYGWLKDGRSKLETQMDTKHCIGVTQNELEEHVEFEKDLAEQQEKLLKLTQEADRLLSLYPPGKWLQEKMTNIDNLLKEVLELCAKRKTHLEFLLEKWNEFELVFKSIIDWIMAQANRLSVKVLNKEDYGVEEHLEACDALTETFETKSSDVAHVEEMADVLEKFDGVKKNGSTDVSSRRNDLDQNWKSFSELLQETQLRLRATHMQLKDAIQVLTEQMEWLGSITIRSACWMPSFGDIKIVENQIAIGGELLEEAESRDKDMKFLGDTSGFVEENSKKDDRQPTVAAIKDTIDRFEHLKTDLKLRIDHFNDSIPLWEEFTADTGNLQAWLDDVEDRYASDKCQPGDAIQTASALQMTQAILDEVKGKRGSFQNLTPVEEGLTAVCDIDEDREFVVDRVEELNEEYKKLLKSLRDHMTLLEMRLESWKNYPVNEAVEVRQYLEEAQMEMCVEISPEDDPEKMKDVLDKLEDINRNQEAQFANLEHIDQSTGSSELAEDISRNPDIAKVTQQLKDQWLQVQSTLQARLEGLRKSYALVANIEERLRKVKEALDDHRSLITSPMLPGPQLEADLLDLVQSNDSCRQATSQAVEELREALKSAQENGVTVPNRLNLESESSFESAQGLATDSEKWEEEITAKCEQWKDFRGRLKEFCNCCGELYDHLIIGIDSRPIGVFLEDLDAFRTQLEEIQAQFDSNSKFLPELEGKRESFLFGSSPEVKELQSEFEQSCQQSTEIEEKLKEYFDRLKSWEEYFGLLNASLSWFRPFKVIVDGDIEDFAVAEETADPSPMVKRFRKHGFEMEKNEPKMYTVRDFPLSIADVTAEKDSVESIVTEREEFIASYEELKDKVMASLKEAESLEENWRQSASETARRRKVLEVQVEEQAGTINTLQQKLRRGRRRRRHPCYDWKLWLFYFVFIDVVILYLIFFKPRVFFPCNACGGTGPMALAETKANMIV